jgi:hypothetical protein
MAAVVVATIPSDLVAQPAPVEVSVSPNVNLPVQPGTPITWTASASGGVVPYQFLYYLYDGSQWNLVTNWSDSGSWTWTPVHSGEYIVEVWVRNATHSNLYTYDAFALYGPFTISPPPQLTVHLARPCPRVCSAASDPIELPLSYPLLTAIADGGDPPYTYRYFMNDGTGWTPLGDWSSSPLVLLPIRSTGHYQVQVWVRNELSSTPGSSVPFDAWGGSGIDVVPSTGALDWLDVTPATPTSPGVPIKVTADTTAPPDSRSYRFLWRWIQGPDVSGWHVGREWGTSNTWTFTPQLPLGDFYSFQVWIRGNGSDSLYDKRLYHGDHFLFPTSVHLGLVSLTPDRTFPVPAGTAIKWTAQATGGTGPYSYCFFAFDGASWQVSGWSADPTWTWIPPHSGSYSVQVWVKGAGSSALYDAWLPAGDVEIGAPAALTVSRITAAPSSPYYTDSRVTFEAQATGGAGPYSYRFLLRDGTTWSVGQEWSAQSRWIWQPAHAGNYALQVWDRSEGSHALLDAWSYLVFLDVRSVPLTVESLTLQPSTDGAVVATAKASGGIGPYTYQFFINVGGSWSIGQEWSPLSTWTFTPPVPIADIQVWVRNAQSAAPYDSWRAAYQAGPLAKLAVTPEPPQPATTPLLVTANAALGTPPFMYRFTTDGPFLNDPPTILQDWSPSNTVLVSGGWFGANGGVVKVDVRDADGATRMDAAILTFPTEVP